MKQVQLRIKNYEDCQNIAYILLHDGNNYKINVEYKDTYFMLILEEKYYKKEE